MVAGARARDAVLASRIPDASEEVVSPEDEAETARRAEYVAAADALTQARQKLETEGQTANESGETLLMVRQQADAAEEEYRELLAESAELDAAIRAEAQNREESERAEFALKSEIFAREKTREDLLREKTALEAARPKATVLENLPTPISKRVEEGREGFFRLKNGRIAHVPLNEFQERLRLSFKNFRGDLTQKTIEDKIGPVEKFTFRYVVDITSSRDANGTSYYMQLRYGECVPINDEIGEPVDVALASKESDFYRALLKYDRDDAAITVFVYPDSFQYLRDVKKALFSLKYQMAMRPLPDGTPISVSPNGTASATY